MSTITDEIVITSAGKISREVYHVKDCSKNFYVQGSMGASLAVGIGIALCKPNQKVIVIAGDGENIEEAINDAKSAFGCYVDVALEKGEIIKEPSHLIKTKRINITIPLYTL